MVVEGGPRSGVDVFMVEVVVVSVGDSERAPQLGGDVVSVLAALGWAVEGDAGATLAWNLVQSLMVHETFYRNDVE